MTYQAFLSYSHSADDKLSPAVQSALHRFAKPWYRRRAMRVFRDQTSLAADPSLWNAIQRALESSEYLLLMASTHAARSAWVNREVEWWLSNRSADKLLVLLTEGDLVWDPQTRDWDWQRTTALPPALGGRVADEPLYVDLRWAHEEAVSLRHARFRAAILDIAATIRGIAKDELEGEDVRQGRDHADRRRGGRGDRALRYRGRLQAVIATQQRTRAEDQARIARSREIAVSAITARERIPSSRSSWGLKPARWRTLQKPRTLSAARLAGPSCGGFSRAAMPGPDMSPSVRTDAALRLRTEAARFACGTWRLGVSVMPSVPPAESCSALMDSTSSRTARGAVSPSSMPPLASGGMSSRTPTTPASVPIVACSWSLQSATPAYTTSRAVNG